MKTLPRLSRIGRACDSRTAGRLASLCPGPEGGIVAQATGAVRLAQTTQILFGVRQAVRRSGAAVRCAYCPSCKAQHFPRTDPVVITVVEDKEGDRCLLGQSRGRLQRMRMYSALAGFMDQGEAIEEAVAREIMEEAGIRGEECALPLVAAMALPVVADDWLHRRGRDYRYQYGC